MVSPPPSECNVKRKFELSEEQKSVVESDAKHLMVVAGAGSGKTETVVQKIIYDINNRGVDPSKILFVTFCRDASKSAIARLSEYGVHGVNCSTIHSHCYQSLKNDNWRSTIISAITERILQRIAINDVLEQSERLRDIAINRRGDIKYVCSQMNGEEIRIFDASMEMLKQKYRVVTFTDLIRIYTYHLKRDAGLMFEKVYVDEIQDCSKSQIAFLTELSFHTNYFCAIGDGKQAIYGSMNASNDGLWSFNDTVRAFSSVMNDLTILQLRDNYRSAKNIVRFAEDVYRCTGNDVLEQNVINKQNDGIMECIRIHCGDRVSEFHKATTEFVVEKIEELRSRGVEYKDILVTSPQVNMHGGEGENIAMIARALNQKNIPFYKSSAVISPDDVYEYCAAFLILMKYGIVYNNRLYIERLLLDKCRDNAKREKIVNAVLDKRKVSAFGDDMVLTGIYSKFISIISSHYDKDNFDVHKAMQSARQWCEYIKKDYMKDITEDMVSKIDDAYKEHNGVLDWDDFTSALENITAQRNGVCVSSIHKTKGLEWKYVIIINALDTSSKGVNAPGFFCKNPEEATNLMYVAITRAMNGCYVVTTENSNSSLPVLNALRVASVINKTHEEVSYC